MNRVWYKEGEALLTELRNTELARNQLAIWYIGQCGVILKYRNKLLGIDLVLNDLLNVEGKTRRNYPAPFLPEELTSLDYVLCTHNHKDHLNMATLKPLEKNSPKTTFVVPASDVSFLEAEGISQGRILGARHHEEIIIGDGLSISPLAQAHNCYESDEDGNYKSLGYILQCGDMIIYHGGDMIMENQIIQELKSFDKIDLAFLPINGRDWEREQRGIIGNMNPREAVGLANLIDVDMVIPTHYDMIQGNCEDPLIFARYMQQYADGRKYHVMMLGERFIYQK